MMHFSIWRASSRVGVRMSDFDDPLFGRLLVAEPVEDRQYKGGRLAGAGLGTADEVLALDGGRDRLRLNFGRDGVAGGKNTLHQRVGKTK